MEKEERRGQEVDTRKELKIGNNRKNKEKKWRNNDKGWSVSCVVRRHKSWKEKERVKKLQRMENKEMESYGAEEERECRIRKNSKRSSEKRRRRNKILRRK